MKSKSHVVMIAILIIVAAFGLTAAAPYQTDVPPDAAPTVEPATPPLDVAPGDTPPLTTPDYVPALLTAGLSFLITAGIQSLKTAFPKIPIPPLEGQVTAISGAIVYALVTIINAFLTLVPPEHAPTVVFIFTTIGGLISMYGVAGLFKKLQTKTATK